MTNSKLSLKKTKPIVFIETKKAPAAIGPYSQAIVINKLVFCSGQIGLDPKTGQLKEGIKNQTKQTLENIEQVLKAAGTNLKKVIKTTIYLVNISDFATVNQIYASYFKNHKPARATVEVSRLPKEALIEIEAIAVV